MIKAVARSSPLSFYNVFVQPSDRHVTPFPPSSYSSYWFNSKESQKIKIINVSSWHLISLMHKCSSSHLKARSSSKTSLLVSVDPSCESWSSSAQGVCHLRPLFFVFQTNPLVPNQRQSGTRSQFIIWVPKPWP